MLLKDVLSVVVGPAVVTLERSDSFVDDTDVFVSGLFLGKTHFANTALVFLEFHVN